MAEKLNFNNGKFRLMLVGDPHEKPGTDTPEDRAKLSDYLRLQNAAVEKLKPDLVILMGDNFSADTAEELEKVCKNVLSPYENADVYVAGIFGNHDLQKKINTQQQHLREYHKYEKCLFARSDVSEWGDYYITLYSSDGEKPIFNLFFLYSGDRDDSGQSYYAIIKRGQIEWYESAVKRLAAENGGAIIPSMVFQHIPVVEEYRLCREVSPLSLLGSGVPGLNSKKGKYYVLDRSTGVTGYMGEAPCSPDVDSGQFTSWKKTGDVIAAFFGHDHLNDFIGSVDGITLGQCKLSGFRQYGDGMRQGVRMIELNESDPKSFETKMYYYRELVGNDCESIHGLIKHFPDRVTTKIDVAEKIAALTAVSAALSLTATFLIKKIRKKH